MSGTAVASLEMRTGQGVARGLDITPFASRFVWVDSLIGGGFSWSLDFAAQQWKEWDDLMMGRESRTVQFRLRSEEDRGSQSTEWRTAYVDKSRASFSQDTSMIGGVKGADRSLLMAQKVRLRVHEQRTVADVLRTIASEYDLTPDIEDTRGARDWPQVQEDDWSFARRIARSSSNASGRGDTYLWVEERTLHFRAPTLSAASTRRYDMSAVENRVDGYAATYAGREVDRMGGATLLGVGFDFRTKTALSFTMNPASAATHPSLAGRVPRRMVDGLRLVPVCESSLPRVEEVVRSRWGRLAPRYLALRIRTRPDLTVKPGTILSMESNLGEQRETPFMGRYVVVEVGHTLSTGAIETHLVCYRREAHEGDAQPTGASADNPATRDRAQTVGFRSTTIVTAQELP